LEAPKGIKDADDFEETKSQGNQDLKENLYDDEECSAETFGRQRVTMDEIKGPMLIDTLSNGSPSKNSNYDLYKKRMEI
jgi:hypothetical protein